MQNNNQGWKDIKSDTLVLYLTIEAIDLIIDEIKEYPKPLLFMPEIYKLLEENEIYLENIKQISKISEDKPQLIGDIYGEQDELEKYNFIYRAQSLIQDYRLKIKNITLQSC